MQRYLRSVRLAVQTLMLHKLRALLTVLGLIFGVSSVVAMLAIAEGASLEAQRQIAELGATNIIIRSMKPTEENNKNRDLDTSYILTYGLKRIDHERIVETIPTVLSATPLREYHKQVRVLENELDARIVAAHPNLIKLTNQKVRRGRFLTDMDLTTYANVAVIGDELAKQLFQASDPIDKTLQINNQCYFRIVGVMARKAPSAGAGSSLAAEDFNKDVYIPITTDRARFGELIMNEKQGSFTAEKLELSQITISVDSMENVKKTASAIESMLKQFHEKTDYGVTVPLELLEKAEATKRIFNMVLGSIAGISLLVGGIGIMNIMLATVTERTREIGIRRALGAKKRDITNQFLIETAVMSATGGLIGVLLGIAIPPLVSKFSGLPVVIQPWSPILAFMIAVSIGVGFGLYPARRAATMDPIEALRHE